MDLKAIQKMIVLVIDALNRVKVSGETDLNYQLAAIQQLRKLAQTMEQEMNT